MSDPDVERIKDRHFADLRRREVIAIVKHDYGYKIHQWSADGVAPQSDYDTPQEAAARALQLLGLKEAVKPQDWPEEVHIGTISKSDK